MNQSGSESRSLGLKTGSSLTSRRYLNVSSALPLLTMNYSNTVIMCSNIFVQHSGRPQSTIYEQFPVHPRNRQQCLPFRHTMLHLNCPIVICFHLPNRITFKKPTYCYSHTDLYLTMSAFYVNFSFIIHSNFYSNCLISSDLCLENEE